MKKQDQHPEGDMSKTLGQILFEAKWGDKNLWSDHSDIEKEFREREAAGIAAVARHVFGEAMAKHVAECHAPKPGPNAWAARPWEMSEKPVKSADVTKWKTTDGGKLVPDPPQPEAGDWAIEAAKLAARAIMTITGVGGQDYIAAAAIICDAAERHYGEKIMDLQMKLLEANNKLLEKVGTPSQVEHAKRLANRLDAMEKERDAAREECERLKNLAEAIIKTSHDYRAITSSDYRGMLEQIHKRPHPATPPTPPAATGDDELREKVWLAIGNWLTYVPSRGIDGTTDAVVKAIRPLFDAVRRERDEALKKTPCQRHVELAKLDEQRAEAAEAALGELRAACEWKLSRPMEMHGLLTPVSPKSVDVVIEEYRTHKAAGGAAEVSAVAEREAERKEPTT